VYCILWKKYPLPKVNKKDCQLSGKSNNLGQWTESIIIKQCYRYFGIFIYSCPYIWLTLHRIRAGLATQITNCFHDCCCRCYYYYRVSIPAVSIISNPASWIYDQFWQKFLSIKGFSRTAISNTLYVLIVSSNCLNSLSNGANSLLMFHQKSVLNKEKLKTRFQSKTQLSHNGLSKLATSYHKLGS